MNLQAETQLNPWSVSFAPWSVSSRTIREISVCEDTDRGQGDTAQEAGVLLMNSLHSPIIIIQTSRT